MTDLLVIVLVCASTVPDVDGTREIATDVVSAPASTMPAALPPDQHAKQIYDATQNLFERCRALGAHR